MSFSVITILLVLLILASFALAADEDFFQHGELPEDLDDTGSFEYIFPPLTPIANAAVDYLSHRILRSARRGVPDGEPLTEEGLRNIEPDQSEQPEQHPPAYEDNQAPAYPQDDTLLTTYDGLQQPFISEPNATGFGTNESLDDTLPTTYDGLRQPFIPDQNATGPGFEEYQTITESWVDNVATAGDRAQPVVAEPNVPFWRQEYPSNQYPNYPGPPPILQPPPQQTTQWSADATDGNGPVSHNNPLRCPDCGHTAQTPGKFRQHQRYHLPEHLRRHPCSYPGCSRRFNFPREMRRHLPVHGGLARHYCPDRGCRAHTRGFGRMDHLERHMKGRHGG